MQDNNDGKWCLLLFVAGDSPQSRQAIANLDQIVGRSGTDAQITVVDLFDNPDAAIERDILAIPTLIRDSPPPSFRIIGDLSDRDRVWSMLNT